MNAKQTAAAAQTARYFAQPRTPLANAIQVYLAETTVWSTNLTRRNNAERRIREAGKDVSRIRAHFNRLAAA